MEPCRNFGWWTWKGSAGTTGKEPGEGEFRQRQVARRKKGFLPFLQGRWSERRPRFEWWQWNSSSKQQSTSLEGDFSHPFPVSICSVLSNKAAEITHRDARRGDSPATSAAEHAPEETLLAEAPLRAVVSKEKKTRKEKKAGTLRGRQDSAHEPAGFNEQEGLCTERHKQEQAGEAVFAHGTQEEEGKGVFCKHFRMTSTTNVQIPHTWDNVRNEERSGCVSIVHVCSERKGLRTICASAQLPPAEPYPPTSPHREGPWSGRSAVDPTSATSHRHGLSTAATSCPNSPAEADQTSPLLSYPTRATPLFSGRLGVAGAAPTTNGRASSVPAEVPETVPVQAAPLVTAAFDEAVESEFPAAVGVVSSAADAAYLTREKHAAGDPQLGVAAFEAPRGCEGSPSRVTSGAVPLRQKDSCAFASLKTAAWRPATRARTAAAAPERSLTPLRCSYSARKVRAPFFVKRLWPPVGAAATGEARQNGPGHGAVERATTCGCGPPEHPIRLTNTWFHEQRRHRRRRRQNREEKAQRDQPKQQRQWLRQQQRWRFHQLKRLRFLFRAQSPHMTHTQNETTVQATSLKTAKTRAFPQKVSFAATTHGAREVQHLTTALLDRVAGTANVDAADGGTAGPSMGVDASMAAAGLSREDTSYLEEAPPAPPSRLLVGRLMKPVYLKTARADVSSSITLADAVAATHTQDASPDNPTHFRCIQATDNNVGSRQNASAPSPRPSSGFAGSLPFSAPSASVSAVEDSSRCSSLCGSSGSRTNSGCSTASPSLVDAAEPAGAPWRDKATQVMLTFPTVFSSSLFSHPQTTDQEAASPSSNVALARWSSSAGGTCRTPRASQLTLSCHVAPPFSRLSPVRTHSSPDMQAFSTHTVTPWRRSCTPPRPQPDAVLCEEQLSTCSSKREGQSSSNCRATRKNDSAAQTSSFLDSAGRSTAAELDKPLFGRPACVLEEKQSGSRQAASSGLHISGSPTTRVTANNTDVSDSSIVHWTAVIDDKNSPSAGSSRDVAAGVVAAFGYKQYVHHLEQQEQTQRRQMPSHPGHTGCARILEKRGELNHQQRHRGDSSLCKKASEISVEASAVVTPAEDVARQQGGVADSPQRLSSSNSIKHTSALSRPDAAASPASQYGQTVAPGGARGAGVAVDCLPSARARSSLRLPCEPPLPGAAPSGPVSAGQDVLLQDEHHHPCNPHQQCRQVEEKGEQQHEQQHPAEPEEMQPMRSLSEQPDPLAHPSQRVLTVSLQEGHLVEVSLLPEQQPSKSCKQEPQVQQGRPTEMDSFTCNCPRAQEPLSLNPLVETQVKEDAAVPACGIPMVKTSAAVLLEKTASETEAAALAAGSEQCGTAGALKQSLGSAILLGFDATKDPQISAATLPNSAATVRFSAPDLSTRVKSSASSVRGQGDATYAKLPTSTTAPLAGEAGTRLYPAEDEVAAGKEPGHVDLVAGAESAQEETALPTDMPLKELSSARTTTAATTTAATTTAVTTTTATTTAATTTPPAEADREAAAAPLGVNAATTSSRPSLPATLRAETAKGAPPATPTAGEAVKLTVALVGNAPEEIREPLTLEALSTLTAADPGGTKPSAPSSSPPTTGEGRGGKEEELTLTEAVLATVGHGVTAALEYGATTLRDFITESLPALSSDEDRTPDCSPSSRQSTHARRNSVSSRSESGNQEFTRPSHPIFQREPGQRSRSIRRACSAGAMRAADAAFQSRWERTINGRVLLPPPLLVRECMQSSNAISTRRQLPPLSSTCRNYRRSNSFSEALHKKPLRPTWYSAAPAGTHMRSPSPVLVPGTAATVVLAEDVEIGASPALQRGRRTRFSSPALAEPISVCREQLPDHILQLHGRPVGVSPAGRPTARRPAPDPREPAAPACTVGNNWCMSRSPMQRWSSPSPAPAGGHTAAPALTSSASRCPPVYLQSGSGWRPWQPTRSVCSPSVPAAGAKWRSVAATPACSSRIPTPRTLSPARSPHVVIPRVSTAAAVESAAPAAEFHAVGADCERTPGVQDNVLTTTAVEDTQPRTRRTSVSLPPMLPKAVPKEVCLPLCHLQQVGGQQQQQQQTSARWQEFTVRNGRDSPLHALRGAACTSQTTNGSPSPQDGVQEQPERLSLAPHLESLQMRHHRGVQQQDPQQQQGIRHALKNTQLGSAPTMVEMCFAGDNSTSSVAFSERPLRPNSCTKNGGLRKPSASGRCVFGQYEDHCSIRYTLVPSPQLSTSYTVGVILQEQMGSQVHQAQHLLQPFPNRTAAHRPVQPAAVDIHTTRQHSVTSLSALAPDTSGARYPVADQSRRHLLTPPAAAEAAARAPTCLEATAAVRTPAQLGQEHVLDVLSGEGPNRTAGGNDAAVPSVDPATSSRFCEWQQRPRYYPESLQQRRRPQEITEVHQIGVVAPEGRGTPPRLRGRQTASTVVAAAAATVGSKVCNEARLTDEGKTHRSSLQVMPNLLLIPEWNSVEQGQQRLPRGPPLELRPFTIATPGPRLGPLQTAHEAALTRQEFNETAPVVAVPPSTHRGERVAVATAADAAPTQDAVVAPAHQDCTWGWINSLYTPLPSARKARTTLNTEQPGLGTESVNVVAASPPAYVQPASEGTGRSLAHAAPAASVGTATTRVSGDSAAAATTELSQDAEAPVTATDKLCVRPPWEHRGLSNSQCDHHQQQKTEQRQELSELHQTQHQTQQQERVQQVRPPSPLRARWLREELLRQRATGQLRKDNFPLDEVESLLHGFHVRKVNGVLIYDVEGQETSRCPTPQSESTAAADPPFCLPDSRKAIGFGSDSGSAAGRQRPLKKREEEARVRTTANTDVRQTRRNDSGSSSTNVQSHVDRFYCNKSSERPSGPATGGLTRNIRIHSNVGDSQNDSQSRQGSPSFDTWLRENHRVGEQFLKDVEQIVGVAATLYATEETEA